MIKCTFCKKDAETEILYAAKTANLIEKKTNFLTKLSMTIRSFLTGWGFQKTECVNCGMKLDADYNAALNILQRGVYGPSSTKAQIL